MLHTLFSPAQITQAWQINPHIEGYVWKALSPKASVLFLHGYADYAKRFVTQSNQLIPHLVREGFDVFAFDMRGHGHSPGERVITDAYQAVQDHLAARNKIEKKLPLYLIGHSLGGLVSVSSVLEQPKNVDGIILLAPALLYKPDNILSRFFLKKIAAISPARKIFKQPIDDFTGKNPLFHTDNEYSRQVGKALNTDPLFYKEAMPVIVPATILSLTHLNWKRYHQLTIPTLVIHGTKDIVALSKGSKRFINQIASPDKTLLLVEDGFHDLLNDTKKDVVLHSIIDWLNKR